MIASTTFASTIFMILATVGAAPTVLTTRVPPPTSSALDFTLYKTTQLGSENQCWTGVGVVHVAPTSIGSCNQADFYVAQVDSQAYGYDCQVNVFDDSICSNRIGLYKYSQDWYPCKLPSSSGLVDLKSWSVTCNTI